LKEFMSQEENVENAFWMTKIQVAQKNTSQVG
jgi:hypothetical protein